MKPETHNGSSCLKLPQLTPSTLNPVQPRRLLEQRRARRGLGAHFGGASGRFHRLALRCLVHVIDRGGGGTEGCCPSSSLGGWWYCSAHRGIVHVVGTERRALEGCCLCSALGGWWCCSALGGECDALASSSRVSTLDSSEVQASESEAVWDVASPPSSTAASPMVNP